MTSLPKDRAALVELLVGQYDFHQSTVGKIRAMDIALRAAEDVGVSMQPDDATEDQLDEISNSTGHRNAHRSIIGRAHKAGPYNRRTDDV